MRGIRKKGEIHNGLGLKNTIGSTRHRALIDFLIARRQASGLTQCEFADAIGEYQSFVARLESGQRRVDVVEFIEFAEVLGFDPARALASIWRNKRKA